MKDTDSDEPIDTDQDRKEPATMPGLENVRALVDLRDRNLQKGRIQFGNRIAAIERGDDKAAPETLELLKRWFERFEEMESECDKDIQSLVSGIEIVERMTQIKGIGKLLAAKTVSMIDIRRADTVSALWRYAGYGVIPGKDGQGGQREKRVKGQTMHYNQRLKVTCYLIGSSLLRVKNSPYRREYESAKARYEIAHPDWTKGHRHNASMGNMIKLFLSHLWQEWRKAEGLPTRELYVMEKLGHQHYKAAADYGWPE